MTGKTRKMFPGGNTANGFYSFFDYIIPCDVNRIFCLKGGPGVGKSSFMKKMAREFTKMGYDVELHYCSSDPSSLDGVVIKELNVVMIDATAPHTVDPKIPGAVDEILNFGEFWDGEKIEENKDKIKSCNADISECFQRAFRFLKSAEPIYMDIESKISKCMDWTKVSKMTDEFVEKVFAGVEFGGKKAYVRHLFGSAITPVGYLDYSDSLFDGVENIYYLQGDIGSGKSGLLKALYTRAEQKGLDVEVYHFPLVVDKLQAVYIPALDLAVTTSSRFKDKEIIDLNSCVDEEKLNKYTDEVRFDKDLVDYLMNNAISNLKRAKFNHDIIEDYYIPAMDFEKVEALKNEIIERILKYKK
ncbi:MAG: PRK06851 family protein [Intestinibacter bartlettii]|uniref:PRK06851 family protein n=1 Tax=Intestinibacter bartlettii TaxID=261299 RepID=UPI0026F11389|nr:PRK06851 family protein [Intestinibacter bartlettii]MDO5010830.1 PRK06851 family protein [Intestinibacter bartlettii]